MSIQAEEAADTSHRQSGPEPASHPESMACRQGPQPSLSLNVAQYPPRPNKRALTKHSATLFVDSGFVESNRQYT